MLSMIWSYRVQKYSLQLFVDLNMLDMTMLVFDRLKKAVLKQ